MLLLFVLLTLIRVEICGSKMDSVMGARAKMSNLVGEVAAPERGNRTPSKVHLVFPAQASLITTVRTCVQKEEIREERLNVLPDLPTMKQHPFYHKSLQMSHQKKKFYMPKTPVVNSQQYPLLFPWSKRKLHQKPNSYHPPKEKGPSLLSHKIRKFIQNTFLPETTHHQKTSTNRIQKMGPKQFSYSWAKSRPTFTPQFLHQSPLPFQSQRLDYMSSSFHSSTPFPSYPVASNITLQSESSYKNPAFPSLQYQPPPASQGPLPPTLPPPSTSRTPAPTSSTFPPPTPSSLLLSQSLPPILTSSIPYTGPSSPPEEQFPPKSTKSHTPGLPTPQVFVRSSPRSQPRNTTHLSTHYPSTHTIGAGSNSQDKTSEFARVVEEPVNRIGFPVPEKAGAVMPKKALYEYGNQINHRYGLLRQLDYYNGYHQNQPVKTDQLGHPHPYGHNPGGYSWTSYNVRPGQHERYPSSEAKGSNSDPAVFEFETNIKISLDTQGYSLTLFLFGQIIILAMFLFSGAL